MNGFTSCFLLFLLSLSHMYLADGVAKRLSTLAGARCIERGERRAGVLRRAAQPHRMQGKLARAPGYARSHLAIWLTR